MQYLSFGDNQMDFAEFYARFSTGGSAVIVRFLGNTFDEVSWCHRIRCNGFQHDQTTSSGVRNVSFGGLRFKQHLDIVGSQHINRCALHGPAAAFSNGHRSADVGLWHNGANEKRIFGALLAIESSAVDAFDWCDGVCGEQF